MNSRSSTDHLRSEELSRWLVEGPDPEAEAHVESCWSCQAKLAEAREPLNLFRSAVVAWSEKQTLAAPRMTANRYASSGWRLLDWTPTALLALAALLLAGFLLGSDGWRTPRIAQEAANAPAPVSDTVLMNQVDQEVSETVPDAMAPLTDLVAWDSGESAVTAKPVAGKKGAAELNPKTRLHVAN